MAEASILPKAVARSVRKLTYVGSLWVSHKTSHDQSNSEVLYLPARSATGRTWACRAQATWNSVSRLSEFPFVLLHRCLIWQPLNDITDDITCQELQRGRSGTYEILWMELPRCETINQLCEALLSLKDEPLTEALTRHGRLRIQSCEFQSNAESNELSSLHSCQDADWGDLDGDCYFPPDGLELTTIQWNACYWLSGLQLLKHAPRCRKCFGQRFNVIYVFWGYNYEQHLKSVSGVKKACLAYIHFR